MARAPRALRGADALMAEVVSYGGFPVTRDTAYRLALDDLEDKQHASFFAFGCLKAVQGREPMTLDDVRAEMAAVD